MSGIKEKHNIKENFKIAVKELLEAIGIDTGWEKPKLPEPSYDHDEGDDCGDAGNED